MKELVRLQDIYTEDDGTAELRDYNLSVFEGEILNILGASDCGKDILGKILNGEKRIKSGNIYRSGKFKAVELDVRNPLMDDLSIAENMELIRRKKFPLQLYKENELYERTWKLLDRLEIQAAPDTKILELSALEKRFLVMEKLITCGVNLIIFHSTAALFTQKETEKLQAYMHQKIKLGITFIILSETPDDMTEIADRIQVMADGADVMEWNKGEITEEQLYSILLKNHYVWKKEKRISGKAVVCILDNNWEHLHQWKTFFDIYRQNNPKIWEQYLNMHIPKNRKVYEDDTAVIPYDSGIHLFDYISLEDNLGMCIGRRTNKGNGVVVNRKAMHVLRREFLEKIQHKGDTNQISDLTLGERKILSVYRWQLLYPKTIILEMPFWGMDMEDIGCMNAYICSVQEMNVQVVMYIRNLEPNINCYDTLILSQAGKEARIL